MALRVRLVRDLGVTVMELRGRVDLGEGSSSYRDALRDAVWNGHRKLALDYGNISYQDFEHGCGIGDPPCPQILEIDRAGVEILVVAQHDFRARGGDLALEGVESA